MSRTLRDGMATIADYRYELPARLRSLECAEDELSHAVLPIPAYHWSLEEVRPPLLKLATEPAAQYRVRSGNDGASGLLINCEIEAVSLGGAVDMQLFTIAQITPTA